MKNIIAHLPMAFVLISIGLLIAVYCSQLGILFVSVANVLFAVPLTIRALQGLATDKFLKYFLETLIAISCCSLLMLLDNSRLATVINFILYIPTIIAALYIFVAEVCCLACYWKYGKIEKF